DAPLLDAPAIEDEERVVPLDVLRELLVARDLELLVQSGDRARGVPLVQGRAHPARPRLVAAAADEPRREDERAREDHSNGQRARGTSERTRGCARRADVRGARYGVHGRAPPPLLDRL